MSALGHLAVGLVSSRYGAVARQRSRRASIGVAALLMALAVAPDLDIIGEVLELAEHRGASHSLGFAMLVAAVAFLVARATGRSGRWWAVATAVAVGSHGILDLFSPGPAVELLWPLTEQRFAAPIRPLPAPPIEISPHSAALWAIEAVIFVPLAAAAWWHSRP